jgi:hypothetical protein
MKTALSTLLFILCSCLPAYAQEDALTVQQGRRYIDLNIRSLEKLSHRTQQQQQRLLKKLTRREHKLVRQLKQTDSAAYARLDQQPLSFDSISRLLRADSAGKAARVWRKGNKAIDSLRGLQSFLRSKAGAAGTVSPAAGDQSAKLGALQTDLNYQQYINSLIDQRSLNLNYLAGNAPALKGIQKDIFYGKSKLRAWKEMADDPSKAEEKALEWLQGAEGFDKAFSQAGSEGVSMQSATSADDLEKMGFQTKRQVNATLKEKFGDGLSGVQQNMGAQVSGWQQQAQGVTGKATQAGNELKAAKADLSQTKQSLASLKDTKLPGFKVNPMRGLPFRQRIEKQYGWQTSRATLDGQPALLQLSGMAGFRHTPSLSYGLGISTSIGLGKDWNNIRFSFEGLGLRSYAAWKWKYGFGAYAGYERVFKQAAFTNNKETSPEELTPSVHNTNFYQESVLIGLTKSYRINSRWNGAVQLLYDVWWKEKGLRSPVVLRFNTIQ